MNRILLVLLLTGMVVISANGQKKPASKPQPKSATKVGLMGIPESYNAQLSRAQQALVVTMPGWNSVDGTLQRYERQNGHWQPVGDKVPVAIAKNGIGWDANLEESPAEKGDPVKHEGDGRSPAGIFRISELFGFDAERSNANMPYQALSDPIECVDDANSMAYNQIVDRSQIPHPDWDSSEKMRAIDVYKHGAVVAYNDLNMPGSGSCIFLHIWKGPGHGTAGCTSMDEAKLQEVLAWLDSSKYPVLVQFPAAVYAKLKDKWQLP